MLTLYLHIFTRVEQLGKMVLFLWQQTPAEDDRPGDGDGDIPLPGRGEYDQGVPTTFNKFSSIVRGSDPVGTVGDPDPTLILCPDRKLFPMELKEFYLRSYTNKVGK